MTMISDIRDMTGNIRTNEPMSKHTSFCIGGEAEIFIEIQKLTQLRKIVKYAKTKDIPLFILGRGTNLLVKDKGIRGIILRLTGDFQTVEFAGEKITAGAAVDLQVLASKSFARGLSGLEFAVGIPGSVGGAVVGNAGAYEEAIGDIIEEVTVMDLNGRTHLINKDKLKFQYRYASIPVKGVVLKTGLKLRGEDKNVIIKKVQSCIEKRKKTQGINFPNAGCIFKNPSGSSAGKLIEEAGLKGYQLGGAQVSVKHANYIVNAGGATSEDVLNLIEEIKRKIKEKFGIFLELEIKVAGE
ncbi:MAG: UDP-N-acetylmuramate dehydrogenase [bacterium]